MYDFALYDLFFKPYGLLRLAGYLEQQGYQVEFINALDYQEPYTLAAKGLPRRRANGTGKFHRQRAQLPPGIQTIPRQYSRYGVLPEVFAQQVAKTQPDMVLITSQMTYWYQGLAEAVRVVRQAHPSVPVVVGGIYATLMPQHCRTVTGADEVVLGEGLSQLPGLFEKYKLNAPKAWDWTTGCRADSVRRP
ncbi:MAG: cobalamin B12-binding domain-containing protein [Spirochaetia bacterium]|nr:cobalamin B12-binding domain-containing protein [Spirochaetia bacterium]